MIMKKNVLLIFCLILLAGSGLFAQQYAILAQPAGEKLWGYADLSGNMFIAPQFKKAVSFSEDGLAAIYDKEFYFITMTGGRLMTEVKGFKLIEIFGFGIKGFQDGFAPVKPKDKWGFLNTEGKLSIPDNYDKVTQFNSGFASVQKEGKFIVLDKSGTEFIVDIAGIKDLNEFSEGFATFRTADDLVGYVDGSGKAVIDAKFKAAGDFHGGLAWAKTTDEKVGFIDTKGEWVITPQFEVGKHYDPVSGLARVKNGERWGYVNKSGEVFFMTDTDLYEDFMEGLARGRKNGQFGYFNSKMEWAIQPQYDGARDFRNGYASVRKGDKWGVIDDTGKMVIEPKFDDIKDVEVIR
jgi:hypothetical protein